MTRAARILILLISELLTGAMIVLGFLVYWGVQ